MDKESGQGQESVHTNKVRAGRRRTYFFDVRKTKGEDFYITLTESTKRFNGEGYNRHKLFLYKEDFNRFLEGLQETIDHVKESLMPDYDYEQFDRRQEEWERQKALEAEEAAGAEETKTEDISASTESSESTASTETESAVEDVTTEESQSSENTDATENINTSETDIDEDMSW